MWQSGKVKTNMAGISLEVEVKVCEISLQEDDENEVYSPDPYEVSVDANSIYLILMPKM